MLMKTEGIIIRTIDYGESNKIITLFTNEAGKLGVMARGAKKPKSRLSSISQLFTYGQFLIQKGTGLGMLNQGEMIDSYRNIRKDIFHTAYAAYMVEMLDKLTDEGKPSPALFLFLQRSLQLLNEGADPEVLKFIFEVKMLRIAGISPEVDLCSNCRRAEGDFSFSIKEGGFLCHRCAGIDPYRIKISAAAAKLLRLFYHIDINRLGTISVKDQTKAQLKHVLTTYFDEYSGLKLKSKRFLDQLEKF
jgi:DNA repair protein RecO (recombination protein O)